jgi:signal transduction histidine kinase
VTVGALPTVQADDQQLYSVLLNLISNAVKYARPHVPPVVDVSSARRDGAWRVSIKDNGIGIPADEHDRVFGLFNRVETSVEGSGIGLATVKRIIEAHGGRIGIDPVDGPGTIVWFELPDTAALRG